MGKLCTAWCEILSQPPWFCVRQNSYKPRFKEEREVSFRQANPSNIVEETKLESMNFLPKSAVWKTSTAAAHGLWYWCKLRRYKKYYISGPAETAEGVTDEEDAGVVEEKLLFNQTSPSWNRETSQGPRMINGSRCKIASHQTSTVRFQPAPAIWGGVLHGSWR